MFVARLITGSRLLLGTIFFVFGLDGFLHFLPLPPPTPPAAAFMGALAASGWVVPLLKATELGAGVLLLGNRFVPLALALLAPIVVNIVGYHAVLEPMGLPVALLVLVLELALAYAYRGAFAPMLRARVEPAAVRSLTRLSRPAVAPT